MRLTRRRPELEAEARPALRLPVLRSGTSLEVAEVAWTLEGVSREAALTLTPVAASRNLIVDAIVQLRPYLYRGDERLDPGWLLTKPDPSMTWSATIAGTVDDLLFHGRAYWRVLERDSEGFPRRARWTPFSDVSPQTRSSGGSFVTLLGYRIAGVRDEVPVDDVIRFDGVNPPILETGARCFAGALELEAAARRLASVELPAGILKNEGTELGDEEAQAFVERFELMRRTHGVAFLQGIEYSRESLSADDLALIPSRDAIVADVARLFGVPVSMISGSPSGGASAHLYENITQTLSLLISSTCAPHLSVLEDTLSDVVARGQAVAFDTARYVRADPQAAADYVKTLLDSNLIDVAEGRSMLGIPSSGAAAPDLTPGRV